MTKPVINLTLKRAGGGFGPSLTLSRVGPSFESNECCTAHCAETMVKQGVIVFLLPFLLTLDD